MFGKPRRRRVKKVEKDGGFFVVVVYRGDMLLEKIQSALADIAQSQLKTRSGTHSQSLPDS